MAKGKTYTRHGFAATAATLSEARAMVEAQIGAALVADYGPIFIQSRGVSFIGWRDMGGWSYGKPYGTPDGSTVRAWPEAEGKVRPMCSLQATDRRAVERSMRSHLAQYVSTIEDRDPPEGTILDPGDAADFRAYMDRAREQHAATLAGLAA